MRYVAAFLGVKQKPYQSYCSMLAYLLLWLCWPAMAYACVCAFTCCFQSWAQIHAGDESVTSGPQHATVLTQSSCSNKEQPCLAGLALAGTRPNCNPTCSCKLPQTEPSTYNARHSVMQTRNLGMPQLCSLRHYPACADERPACVGEQKRCYNQQAPRRRLLDAFYRASNDSPIGIQTKITRGVRETLSAPYTQYNTLRLATLQHVRMHAAAWHRQDGLHTFDTPLNHTKDTPASKHKHSPLQAFAYTILTLKLLDALTSLSGNLHTSSKKDNTSATQ